MPAFVPGDLIRDLETGAEGQVLDVIGHAVHGVVMGYSYVVELNGAADLRTARQLECSARSTR